MNTCPHFASTVPLLLFQCSSTHQSTFSNFLNFQKNFPNFFKFSSGILKFAKISKKIFGSLIISVQLFLIFAVFLKIFQNFPPFVYILNYNSENSKNFFQTQILFIYTFFILRYSLYFYNFVCFTIVRTFFTLKF